MKTYLRDIARTPLLSATEERELLVSARAGDRSARDRMIVANLRLVVSIAKRYRGRGLDIEDLISLGNKGLMEAVEKYDLARSVRFSTYATFQIKKSITRGIADCSSTVRVPQYARCLAYKALKYGADPGHRAEIVKDAIRALMPMNQIDGFKIPRREEEILDDEPKKRILAAIETLPDRHRELIQRRFGLNGHKPHRLVDIGNVFGISRERVRQIEEVAMKWLRKAWRTPAGETPCEK